MNLVNDVKQFISKFGFDAEEIDAEKLKFRLRLLREEFNETSDSVLDQNAEEFVDGHIDVIIIAIGNLLLSGVDVDKAWNEVHTKNMMKIRGIKPGRESSGGFDVIKPTGWVKPNHEDNHGKLNKIWNKH